VEEEIFKNMDLYHPVVVTRPMPKQSGRMFGFVTLGFPRRFCQSGVACYMMLRASEIRKMKQGKKHRATLRDVAKAAGVGTTTVSRVINGGFRVAPEMLTRI
jgi:hypothetical protein